MLKDFKEFAVKGNVVDMAVGIIIGGAFGAIAKSLVTDVIMPPVGMLMGKVDFTNMLVVLKEGTVAGPYPSPAEAQKVGAVTLNYGLFVNSVISFLIVAFAVFLMIRAINKLKREQVAAPPDTKECPFCCSNIPVKAIRCPSCTSELAAQ